MSCWSFGLYTVWRRNEEKSLKLNALKHDFQQDLNSIINCEEINQVVKDYVSNLKDVFKVSKVS